MRQLTSSTPRGAERLSLLSGDDDSLFSTDFFSSLGVLDVEKLRAQNSLANSLLLRASEGDAERFEEEDERSELRQRKEALRRSRGAQPSSPPGPAAEQMGQDSPPPPPPQDAALVVESSMAVALNAAASPAEGADALLDEFKNLGMPPELEIQLDQALAEDDG
jgi:hypothetical protein